MSKFKTKHLLGLKDISKNEITEILKLASKYKYLKSKKVNLQDEALAFLFFENSTRTRISFELAAKKLGISTINFDSTSSSISKGESLVDTMQVLESLGVTVAVVRHKKNCFTEELSKMSNVSIINAGEGSNEHPSQGLLDLFTLQEYFPNMNGVRIGFVGDIEHSRVARSDIYGLQKYGVKIFATGPKNLLPKDLESMGVKVVNSLDELINKVDVIIALRIQYERMDKKYYPTKDKYFKEFGITNERLEKQKRKILIMHPGPINRELEISSEVADSSNSLILQQVSNGIPVRMGIISWIVSNRN